MRKGSLHEITSQECPGLQPHSIQLAIPATTASAMIRDSMGFWKNRRPFTERCSKNTEPSSNTIIHSSVIVRSEATWRSLGDSFALLATTPSAGRTPSGCSPRQRYNISGVYFRSHRAACSAACLIARQGQLAGLRSPQGRQQREHRCRACPSPHPCASTEKYQNPTPPRGPCHFPGGYRSCNS